MAGISEEVAKWITTAYKNIVGVGVDVPTVDPGNSMGRAALKTLTSHGVYVLDHVKLDQYLPGSYLLCSMFYVETYKDVFINFICDTKLYL